MSWPTGQISLYLSISRARALTNHSIHILFDCQFLDHFVFMLRIFFCFCFFNIPSSLSLSISLFCDSLRFCCGFPRCFCCDFVVFIAVLLASHLCHSIVVFLLLFLRCKCVCWNDDDIGNITLPILDFALAQQHTAHKHWITWSLLSFAFRLLWLLLHLFTRNGTITSTTIIIVVHVC